MAIKGHDHVRVNATGRTGRVVHIDNKAVGNPPKTKTGIKVEFDNPEVRPSSDWFKESELTKIS